jgi:predicted phosphodiesterase
MTKYSYKWDYCKVCGKRTTSHKEDGSCVCPWCKNMKNIDNKFSEQDLNILAQIKKTALLPEEIKLVLSSKHPAIKKEDYDCYFGKDRLKIGVISDMHIGSKSFNYHAYELALREFNKEKVDAVYCPGDILEGMSQRDGQIYELNKVGYTEQLDEAVRLLKRIKQPFYFITGNHDQWAMNKGNMGLNVGQEIQEKIPNAHFLGEMEAYVNLGHGQKMKLTHRGNTAYALSYSGQKQINGLEGGTKPAVILNGHLHKALYMNYRNINYIECFDGNTKVITKDGEKKIRDIKLGEEVLTHKNRFRKVINTMNRNSDGNFVRLFFRNMDECSNIITSTPEHPVMVIKNNKKVWVKAKDIVVGDKILIKYNECKHCKKHIPYWGICCSDCIDLRKRNMQLKSQEKYRARDKKGTQHYKEDILPYADKLKSEGYKVLAIGDFYPDIIAIKDNKIIAYEIEKGYIKAGREAKYDNNTFFDDIKWVITDKGNKEYSFRRYDVDEETGFIIVPVLKTKHFKKRYTKVYNLEVEEDNSYLASKVVVHNCGTLQNQTEFMSMKGSPSNVGFYIIEMKIGKNGVSGFKPAWYPVYLK